MSDKVLPDIQATKDRRGVCINRVGVEKIDFPLLILTKSGKKVLVYATIDLYSSLKHSVKGTNMSRFVEILMQYKYVEMDGMTLKQFLRELKRKLGDVEDVFARITFKYFLPKTSPVSKKPSIMAYQCSIVGKLSKTYRYVLEVDVLTTSNCPCSKEISDYGAHGQRSRASVSIEPEKNETVYFADLIRLVEQTGSCEVYPLLKRPDEKYVTERAYNNPKFVEDAARDISLALQQIEQVRWFKVKVSNEESIHPHDAVCYIERVRKGKKWRKCTKSLRRGI